MALTGFKYIELIDLDTIDVSNLNRQFLFRPQHVGQPKAIVAGNAAKLFNPDITVVSYHDNIKSPKFNLAYFGKFDLVLNALDNIDARRHVNRLCLAADIPLIDSGTTGYLGQVMPILKAKTACYECFPKPTQKVYPICTIRSTPDKPVHCIVWAKECFKLLFNQPSESMLFEDVSTGETSTYMHLISYPDEVNAVSIARYGKDLVTALYRTEIDKRLQMEVYKTAKVVPAPLDLEAIESAVEAWRTQVEAGAQSATAAGWDHKTLSPQENIALFLSCLHEVAVRDRKLIGQLSFDKDDLWAMKFVTAASNLRSHVFTIPLLSFHDAKGIAGNIIPAIATTNAIVAGIQVMQAVRLLTQKDAMKGTNSALQVLLYILVHYFSSNPCIFIMSMSSILQKYTVLSTCLPTYLQPFIISVPLFVYAAQEGETAEQHLSRVQHNCPHTYCLRLPTRKGLYLQPCQAEAPVPACYVCGASEVTVQVHGVCVFCVASTVCHD